VIRGVPGGEQTWVIAHLGYATWEQPFEAQNLDQLTIRLMPRPLALERITVTVNRLEQRRNAAPVAVHTLSRDEVVSSVSSVAAELVRDRSPWIVTGCPANLGATVYPHRDGPPNESTLHDPGQPMWVPTELCVRFRGRALTPRLCLDDRPITMVELTAYAADEIYAVEYYGSYPPQVRLYTTRFLERGKRVMPFAFGCH